MSLSERELEVLHLIAAGLPNREIAVRLAISPRTVEAHKDRMKMKLQLPDTTALYRYAITKEGALM